MSVLYIADEEEFLLHDTAEHPECALRAKVIHEALSSLRLFTISPEPATNEQLLRAHSQEHIDHIIHQCENAKGVATLETDDREGDTHICEESERIARLAAGAGILAVDQLLCEGLPFTKAYANIRPPGHHATHGSGMGFCLYNNAAIAALHALTYESVNRVLIIDWDVHHGNGTQDIVESNENIFYFSTHMASPHYPGTGHADESGDHNNVLNVPIAGLGESYCSTKHSPRAHVLDAFANLPAVLNERGFLPDLIIISAGFDAYIDDPLGNFDLEIEDFRDLTAFVNKLAADRGGCPIISMQEGGYNTDHLGEIVRAHVEALMSDC